MQLNKPEMAKVLKEQAAHRNLEITDEHIENIMNEVVQTVAMAALMPKIPLEHQLCSMFCTGALFGLDRCKPQTENLVLKSEDGEEFKVAGRYQNKKDEV